MYLHHNHMWKILYMTTKMSLDIKNLAVLKFDHDCLMNVGVTKEYVE